MAVIFLDSCDHYTSPIDKWDASIGVSVSAGSGRNGTAGLTGGGGSSVRKNLAAAVSDVIVGRAYQPEAALAGGTLLQLSDSGTVQLELVLNSNGSLAVLRGASGTLLGTTSAGLLSGAVWAYIEMKATIHNSTGAAVVRVNGIAVLTLSNVDTQVTANATVDQVTFFIGGAGRITDDIYIADNSGGVNDDFLGDVRVQYRAPTGAGNSTAWTPSAGNNWENVDDAAPDGDTTYNSATLAGSEDLYACEDLSGSPTAVYAVQVINRVREDDSLGHTVAPMIRASATTDTGTPVTVNNSYATKTEVWNANPDASAWDPADFPIEAGISLET